METPNTPQNPDFNPEGTDKLQATTPIGRRAEIFGNNATKSHVEDLDPPINPNGYGNATPEEVQELAESALKERSLYAVPDIPDSDIDPQDSSGLKESRREQPILGAVNEESSAKGSNETDPLVDEGMKNMTEAGKRMAKELFPGAMELGQQPTTSPENTPPDLPPAA